MPRLNDIAEHLAGAWDLFRGDANGLERMDTSFDGFWRSFAAILLVLPVYGLYLIGEQRMAEAQEAAIDVSAGYYIFSRGAALLVDWLAFPVLMIGIVYLLDCRSRYVPYVVAYNWGGVILSVLVATPTILFGFGLIPMTLASILTLVGLVLAIRYRYIIARVALFATIPVAAALVATEFLLSLLLADLLIRTFGI